MLNWRGREVQNNLEKAVRIGINRTMGEAVAYAKANHSFRNQTGTLERSIRVVRGAAKRGSVVFGVWGSAQVVYALFVEFGTFRMRALPFLRPAAQTIYPNLDGNIKKAAKELGF